MDQQLSLDAAGLRLAISHVQEQATSNPFLAGPVLAPRLV